MSEVLVSLQQVSKIFGHAEQQRVVLSKVDLQINQGDRIAVIGPSGSGKSTLLNLIAGLDQVSSGTLKRHGLSQDASERELAQWRNSHIGFVFQDHHLLPQYTVSENILLPICAFRKVDKKDEQRALALLDSVQLGDRAASWPQELSGGERQRVAVLRALMMQPRLLLADEPSGALDHENAQQIADILDQLQRHNNCALLVVTHQLELANRMSQQLQLMNGVLQPVTP